MRTYISLHAPHRWVQVDRAGKPMSSGVVEELDSPEIPFANSMVVGVVPGSDVTIRDVTIPARQRSKVVAAIPFALEDTLSADIETLHFSLLKWAPGTPALVGICSRDKIDQWCQDAVDAGIRLDAIVPDFLLLPLHPQSRITVARTGDNELSVRSADGSALVLDEDLLEYWWQDLDTESRAVAVNDNAIARKLVAAGGSEVSEWNIGDNFTSWVANHDELPSLDMSLMQGDFEAEHRGKSSTGLKVAAVIFGLSLAIKLGSDGAEYFWLTKRNEQLNTEIQQVWSKTFPGSKQVDPFTARTQMENKLNQLRSGVTGSGDFQQLLSVVSKAVPQSDARVEEVAFRDNELILTCSTADFAGLDRFKQQIEQSPDVSVELQSSSSRDNRVSGQFKLTRRGA